MDTPIIHTIAEACAVGRIGRTALYEAIRAGELRAIKRGRRTLILAADLRRWLEAMPTVRPSGDTGRNGFNAVRGRSKELPEVRPPDDSNVNARPS
jgi:excisionase family DNA binding protein